MDVSDTYMKVVSINNSYSILKWMLDLKLDV